MTIVAKDKRITVKHIRDMETAGIKRIEAPDDFILGRALSHNVIASVTPYADELLRFGTSIATDEADVDRALSALRALS